MLVDDPVKRVDNMTMAHGLEARTPFLDHDLVELAARCPPELKLAEGGKGVLKRAARGVVPDGVIDRPKGYFPVPALSHLEGPVLELVTDALTSAAARGRGLFRPAAVDAMLRTPTPRARTSTGLRCGSSACWSCGCRRTSTERDRRKASMGEKVAATQFSREDRQRYREKVKRNLDVFARMLREARFDADKRSIGLEIELNLTDNAGEPALMNQAALEQIADPAFVTELGAVQRRDQHPAAPADRRRVRRARAAGPRLAQRRRGQGRRGSART